MAGPHHHPQLVAEQGSADETVLVGHVERADRDVDLAPAQLLDQDVVEAQCHRHPGRGTLLAQALHCLEEGVLHIQRRDAHAQGAQPAQVHVAGLLDRVGEVVVHLLDALVEDLGRMGEGHALGRALEQAETQARKAFPPG